MKVACPFLAALFLIGCATFPTETPKTCVIEAANREAVLVAEQKLNPILWRKFLFVQTRDKHHCYLLWRTIDGKLYAHDWRGDRRVSLPGDDPETIARELEAGVELAWFE